MKRIRSHPLVPKSIPVHAYLYQVETGRIVEVQGASATRSLRQSDEAPAAGG